MNTGIGHIGTIALTRARRGVVRRAVIAALVVAGLMMYVGGKVQIMRLGYRIEALEKEKRELERANRGLRIEASSLASPARIEEFAVRKLGMVHPAKENIVIVKRRDEGGSARTTPRKR